jgi:hypothetical protein
VLVHDTVHDGSRGLRIIGALIGDAAQSTMYPGRRRYTARAS